MKKKILHKAVNKKTKELLNLKSKLMLAVISITCATFDAKNFSTETINDLCKNNDPQAVF